VAGFRKGGGAGNEDPQGSNKIAPKSPRVWYADDQQASEDESDDAADSWAG
jgi:hypothetical protein